LDFVGWLARPALYEEPGWASALDFSAAEQSTAAIFACNLANLQDAVCPSFGSNGPLWSLAYEWFYYVTFPFLLALVMQLRQGRAALRSAIIGALAIPASIWLFPAYLSYYPIWLMGVGARLFILRRPLPRHYAYVALALLPVLLAIARPHTYPAFVTDYLI